MAPGGLDGAGLPATLLEVAQGGGEEGLVDAAVENRYAHLHALEDDLSPLHLHLVGEFGGRQVNGQNRSPLPLLGVKYVYRVTRMCQ